MVGNNGRLLDTTGYLMGYYMEYSNSLFLKVTLEQMRFVKLGFRHVHKGEHKAAAASFEHI